MKQPLVLALGAAAIVASALPVAAAEQPLSLGDAIKYALAGNVDLRRERLVIETADANLLAAQGQFDFLFTGTASFSRATQPRLTAEDLAGGFTNDIGLDVGLTRNLETGGQLRFSLQNDAITSNSSFSCGRLDTGSPRTCTFYTSNLGLQLTHPLLRGFGAEIAQANLRRQRIQKDLALLNRQMRAANVIRDVVTTYWELAYATSDLAIRRSAVDLAREQLRITQAQIEVGRLAAVDSAAVERAIGERLQEVAVSEQNVYFRTLDLRRLMGVAPDPRQPAFIATDTPTATPREVDPIVEVDRALENNPQLRALRMGLQLTAIDVQTAANTLKPRLDFIGAIGSRGRNSNYADTLASTAGLDDMTWSAALNFQLPIENRAARGLMRAAELDADRARLDAGELELTIRDTVIRLSSNIRTASKRVELAKQTVKFATRNLEAERARFSVGRSTNNDVLLRQQELKSAEIQVVRATVDLLNSEAALAAITAEVLAQHNLTLKGL